MSAPADPSGVLPGNHITDWDSLAKLVAFFSEYNGHDWLFRGVSSKSHTLIPRIGRPAIRKRKKTGFVPYSESDEIAVFNQFQDIAHPFVQGEPSKLEWLAIAQHHGMPTRLLDWTENLLIAGWFAIQNVESVAEFDLEGGKTKVKTNDPAIWVTRGIPTVRGDERGAPFKIEQPRSYRPRHVSPRITAQRSVLSIHGDPTTEMNHPEIWCFTLAARNFFMFKKRIDACGINERTLFPGLDGIAKDMAWRYKNSWLAGYSLKRQIP